MLAIGSIGAIPADPNCRLASAKQLMLCCATRKCASETSALLVGAPEDCPNVEAPLRRSIQQVEEGAGPIREMEIGRVESNGNPNAMTRSFDRLGYTTECWNAVNQWPDGITGARRIRCRYRKRYTRGKFK